MPRHRHRRQEGPALSLLNGSKRPALSSSKGFTIIEVMMAATILVVGFMGMIQALTIGSEMIATARRQTIANQIMTHELEQLRLEDWASTLLNLSTTTTWNSGTAYAVGATVQYKGAWFSAIVANSGRTPPDATAWKAYMTWNSSAAYKRSDLVSYGGTWYRCIANNTSQAPPNATYWVTYSGAIPSTGTTEAVSFDVARMTNSVDLDSDGRTDFQEITVVVSWTKSGTTTAAATGSGSWLDQMAFYRPSPISRTYSRSMTTYFTKYGLNQSAQRS